MSIKNMTKEEAINIVYEDKVPADISEIVSYWGTATKLNDYIANELMEEYYAFLSGKGFVATTYNHRISSLRTFL